MYIALTLVDIQIFQGVKEMGARWETRTASDISINFAKTFIASYLPGWHKSRLF